MEVVVDKIFFLFTCRVISISSFFTFILNFQMLRAVQNIIIADVSHYIGFNLGSRRVLLPVPSLSDLRPSGLSVCWEL